MTPIKLENERTSFYLMKILGYEMKTITCGIPYKLSLLKDPIINTLWESCDHFPLAHWNSMKFLALEKGHIRIKEEEILYLYKMKFWSYLRWKFNQQHSLQFKWCTILNLNSF